NTSDVRYAPGSRNYGAAASSEASQLRRKPIPTNQSTPPESSYASTARKRSPFKSNEMIYVPAISRKLDRKKPSNRKVEVIPNASSHRAIVDDDLEEGDENVPNRRINDKNELSKPETKRGLFYKSSEEKVNKFSTFRFGSRVAPYQEESTKSTEDLSLIRNQLVQIKQQHSSLLDLLQRFIGSSQNGIRCLETRVHGLELALDEISYDLAVTSGRMTKTDSS
ncbi:hypothetical protein UlMin_007560, partial [Ulmus minor]